MKLLLAVVADGLLFVGGGDENASNKSLVGLLEGCFIAAGGGESNKFTCFGGWEAGFDETYVTKY